MNQNIQDTRRQRKAKERQKTMMTLAIAAVVCISLTFAVMVYSSRQNQPAEIPVTFSATASLPAQESLPAETSSPTISAELTPTATPAQTNFPLSDARFASMTLPDKIGQLLMVGVGGMELTPADCELIQQIAPGGVAFHGGNVTSPEQLNRLITDIKNCLGTESHPPLFFAIDHEGQYINRFDTGVTIFPSPLALGATGDATLAYQSALAGGQEISSAGINMVLGPVADVFSNLDNFVIAERSFGGDPQRVGSFVSAAVKGYREAGLVTVLKHFPGHGGVSVDSHDALPVDNADMPTLTNIYLPPFQQGINAGAPLVMLSHISFPQIDSSGQPASLSHPTIDLLRNQLGFNGVILTDDLNMGALDGDVSTFALESIRAGSDMVLILPLSDALSAKNKIQSAAEQGAIPLEQINRSALRILQAKEEAGLAQNYPPPAVANPQANAELANTISSRSVTILKNDDGLIPIPASIKTILIVAPPDAFGLNQSLNAELQLRGYEPELLEYNAPWLGDSGDEGLVNSFTAQAASFDLTVIITWQAHAKRILYEDKWQGELVNALIQNNSPLIVASLKSPADVLEFPAARNVLATFGTTSGQIQSLVDILTGKSSASGVNPLPQLP